MQKNKLFKPAVLGAALALFMSPTARADHIPTSRQPALSPKQAAQVILKRNNVIPAGQKVTDVICGETTVKARMGKFWAIFGKDENSMFITAGHGVNPQTIDLQISGDELEKGQLTQAQIAAFGQTAEEMGIVFAIKAPVFPRRASDGKCHVRQAAISPVFAGH